jgi:hypothetical protein
MGFNSAMDSAIRTHRRRLIIERLFGAAVGAAWLVFLAGGFVLLIAYFGGMTRITSAGSRRKE